MPDDQPQQAADQPTESSSTPDQDALGSALERLAGLTPEQPPEPEPEPVPATAQAEDDEDEEPEEAEPEPAVVSKSDGTILHGASPEPIAVEPEPAEPRLSRRQQKELERQQEQQRREQEWRQKWEQERAQNERLAAAERQRQQADQARRQQLARVLGDDREFSVLAGKVARQQATYEEQNRYQQLYQTRELASVFLDDARGQGEARYRALLGNLAQQAQQVAAKPGVDPNAVKANPQFGAVCEHFYEAGARVEREKHEARLAEKDERISVLEAELRSARLRGAANGRVPEAGGTGSGNGRTQPPMNTNAPPLSQIAAGLSEIEADRRAGRGR